MDKLRAMKVFVRVVECGSFSKAAASLEIANATVTANVRNLERSLGITLLNRDTRSLHLTVEGERYFERCLSILRDVDDAEDELRQQRGRVTGLVAVESPIAFGQALIQPALPTFLEQHPGIQVALRLTDYPVGLIERGTDVAIRMDSVDNADLIARPLYQAKYVICASPDFVARHGRCRTPADLDPKLCLGLFGKSSYSPISWILKNETNTYDIQPKGPLLFNGSNSLINAALAGLGYIQVLDIFTNNLVARGDLIRILPDYRMGGRTFYSVTPRSRFVSPRARAFIDFLINTLEPERRPTMSDTIPITR